MTPVAQFAQPLRALARALLPLGLMGSLCAQFAAPSGESATDTELLRIGSEALDREDQIGRAHV